MSKKDGWIQKKTRTYPKSGRTVTTFVARITPPGEKEISKSFTREGRSDRPGTAAHWLHEQREIIKQKQWVSVRDREWTVHEWATEWLKGVSGVDKSTIDSYRTVIETDIKKSTLGDTLIHQVDKAQLTAWVDSLCHNRTWSTTHKGLALATVTMRRTVLAMIFAAAHDEELIPRNYMRTVKAPKAQLDIEQIDPAELPSPDDVWTMHDIAAEVSPTIAEMIIVAAGSGLRPGELMGLRDSRVPMRADGKRAEIAVVETRKLKLPGDEFGGPKTQAGLRRVPIGDEVDAALARHLALYPVDPDTENGDLMFRTPRGKPWPASSFRVQWDRVRVRFGQPHMRFYLLRHYYVSALIHGGADVRLVMNRVGHSNSTYTLERYARLWNDADEVTRRLSDEGLARDRDGTARSGEPPV